MAGTAEVAVVGGGILGAAAALLCAQRGLAVRWYAPPESTTRQDGAASRAYTLAPRSQALLQELGVWNTLEPQTQAVRAMQLCLGEPAPGVSWGLNAPGPEPLARTCLHSDLLRVLEQAVGYQGRVRRLGAWQPPTPEAGGRGPALPEGALVLAADGATSPVRRAAGILWSRHDYGQKAVVAAFAAEHPHRGVAHQWFQADGRVLALLPLVHPHHVSLVYSMPTAAADAYLGQDPISRAQALPQDSALGALQPRLESSGEHVASAAPLAMGSAERLALGNLLLLGDVGHTVHPLAGYGLNMGFDDLSALAQALSRQLAQDPSLLRAAALAAAVARQRSHTLRSTQWGLHGIKSLMANATAIPAVGRSLQWGLGLLSRSDWARRMLVQAALDGGLPFLPTPSLPTPLQSKP